MTEIKYKASDELAERIVNTFTYHKPFGDQAERYEALRGAGLMIAGIIVSLTPASREQSLALTALEECIMRANQAIALNEVEE